MQKSLLPGSLSCQKIYYQLLPDELITQAIEKGEGVLSNTGALVIDTGKFTGRSPKDRFIVGDTLTEKCIDWNKFNQPISEEAYQLVYKKMQDYMKSKALWVRDCYVCAKPQYRLNLRVINENPCCNLFAYNMFLRPASDDLEDIKIDWHLIQLPRFFGDPLTDEINNPNFVIINFSEKVILIGGTQYTGEIKKALFSILNFLLPVEYDILTMHCSANVGEEGDSTLFFGLSGTGKTTLSSDAGRRLIGDDEHGWDDASIFNLEGGCYAKTIYLRNEKEPAIYNAIKFGSIVENVLFFEGTNRIDFDNATITENTRASYPLEYIHNAVLPSIAKAPANIFFLTADAYGILPPISRLSPEQAMYHFISGYTAKLAGTETGVIEPIPTFSACFGAPFMTLSPARYANMLHEKMEKYKVKVWLINTGWSGGAYGRGERIKLEYTRAMIHAAIGGKLDDAVYKASPLFGLITPASCPGVPSGILDPQRAWEEPEEFLNTANRLARYFIENFEKYKAIVSKEVMAASPKILK